MVTAGISVLVCCYNSAGRLPQTLKYLAAQMVPPEIPWEVIVADNASKDATARVAGEVWENLDTGHAGFKIISETVPGKSHALKKGIETAAYEYILVCDDDNWLAADCFCQLNHETNPFGGLLVRAGTQVRIPVDGTESGLPPVRVDTEDTKAAPRQIAHQHDACLKTTGNYDRGPICVPRFRRYIHSFQCRPAALRTAGIVML